ncbi:MAG: T9SS type A sorting domain-containing protein [Chitinophagales bacterium]|nr:T9SS type A sorting domain-containing protein [Chitinophagales bacterium]
MKKTFTLFFTLCMYCIVSTALFAQWCIPETAIPYSAAMPGITHITLETIDRTSTDLENYPDNSYVNTGLSATLIKGVSYEMSVTYTIDATICPDMNIRVWIDLDQNGSFLDIGETVLSSDHLEPGTFTDSFSLPDYALAGTTRMRVTAKMTNNGGHTLPTPCDNPPDPFGYHGEFEDYDVIIEESSAIDILTTGNITAVVFPNPVSGAFNIKYELYETAPVQIELFHVNGEHAGILFENDIQPAGSHTYTMDCKELHLQDGIYFISVQSGDYVAYKKIIIMQN